MDQQDEPEITTVAPATTAVIHENVPLAQIRPFFDRVFATVPRVIGQQGAVMTGPPVAAYRTTPGDTIDVAAGFPTDRAVQAQEGVRAEELPGGRVARLVHVGDYEGLPASYERLAAWITAQGETAGDLMWEEYLTEPTPDGDPAAMLTRVTWLLA